MSTPPRRRRPDARRPQPAGGGWLPTIAMGLGVVVAGLGIGVLVAVITQKTTGKLPASLKPVAVVTSTPAPAGAAGPPTAPPIAIATFVPPRTPRPSRAPDASAAPTQAPPTHGPSAAPSSGLAGNQTAAPAPESTRAALAATDAEPAATPQRIAAAVTPAAPPTSPDAPPPGSAVSPVATSSALTAPASSAPAATSGVAASPAAASPLASMPAAAGPSSAGESTYDEHASAVVRRYVDALIRGDDKTAYSALGAGGGTLSEQAFLDPSARIVSLKVTRIDASNASVGCEIAAAKGHYYVTYHVTASSGGPYISQHDYIKV